VSTGMVVPFSSRGDSSMTLETILGYFLESQRNAAGTLLLTFFVLCTIIDYYPIVSRK